MTPHERNIHNLTIESCRAALIMGRGGAPDHLVTNVFRSAYTAARYNLPAWAVCKFSSIDIGEGDCTLDELEARFAMLQRDELAGAA